MTNTRCYVTFTHMKKLVTLAVFLLTFACAGTAYPYWIWTPKSGKWTNPKTAAKSTPQEQFAMAKEFYDAKRYEEAGREFKKLLRAFPKAKEAAESQYYLGRIEEEQDNLYEAYLAYQKVIDTYPFSERIQEIIEREFKIAEAFMGGYKRKAMGVALPVENPAIEIFTKVIDNSTYGPLAAAAQYKLGLVLKGLMRYYEAEDAFSKVLANYPESEWAEAAKFQIASCRASLSKGPDYDMGATLEAKEKFERFVKEHPDAVLSHDAEKNIAGLSEKEAESYYNIGRFYEKQKAYDSARIYYTEIIDRYSPSSWAAKALERMQILEAQKKK